MRVPNLTLSAISSVHPLVLDHQLSHQRAPYPTLSWILIHHPSLSYPIIDKFAFISGALLLAVKSEQTWESYNNDKLVRFHLNGTS